MLKALAGHMKSNTESALLKVDGLFFDKIYADLMIIQEVGEEASRC